LQGPKEKDVADAAGGGGSSQSKTPSELTRKQNLAFGARLAAGAGLSIWQ
jgi:hypothetical protein